MTNTEKLGIKQGELSMVHLENHSAEMFDIVCDFVKWFKEPWSYNGRPVYEFGKRFTELAESVTGMPFEEMKKELDGL